MKTGQPVGIDVSTGEDSCTLLCVHACYYLYVWCVLVGEAMLPGDEGVWDNYRVKKTLLHSW